MQDGFGQFCPVALASEVLTQKWMLLIVRELLAGSSRFNDIRRGVPRISATLLKQRLEALEQAKIIELRPSRKRRAQEYVLTKAGKDLKPILTQIGEWGQRWARDIRPEDLDPGWLVWNIRRRLNTEAMPPGRIVIQIHFTDAGRDQRLFWLVKDADGVDVCLKHPGFTVDVYVQTTVRALAEAWRGIRSVKREIGTGSIRLEGPLALRKSFPNWLLLSAYASIKRAR